MSQSFAAEVELHLHDVKQLRRLVLSSDKFDRFIVMIVGSLIHE